MIYIPKKINVGFQNRNGTYTGKLAYVIYYDEHGKLRKEGSWSSWRDESIPNEEYDNEPTEGFVLNKKVGGVEESYGWDPRKTYTRVYDPRGYEFEITIPNLLWILENCNCIKGKGLEGEFVYGWDGKELLLIPTSAPEYKDSLEFSNKKNSAEFIKAKELVLGKTYKSIKGEEYIYLGKFDRWKTDYHLINNKYLYGFNEFNHREGYTKAEKYLFSSQSEFEAININCGKHFFFMCLNNLHVCWDVNNRCSIDKKRYITFFKSISRKFVECSDEVHENYPEFVTELEFNHAYSPVDFHRSETYELPIENFISAINKCMTEMSVWPEYKILGSDDIVYIINYGGYQHPREISYKKCDDNYEKRYCKYYTDNVLELYNILKPVYKVFFLENGNEYIRRFYYESKE